MRLTSLGRSLMPTRFAPSWALFATAVVFFSTWNSHGFDSGFRGGAAVLLAWAITRELAPARPLPSLYAPFLAVAFAIPADTDVVACVAVLFAARIASRTVGTPPTLLDCLAVPALAGWSAMTDPGLPAGLVLAAVLFVQGPLRTRVGGLLALLAALSVGAVEGTLTVHFDWNELATGKWILLALLVLGALRLVVTRLPERVKVKDDRRIDWLRGANIRSSRAAVVAALVAVTVWTGSDGPFALSAVGAAVVVVGLGGVKLRARRGARESMRPSAAA